MLFGLACEGVTDQITLENVLCGYFINQDIDEEIKYLQPAFDETDQKQKGDGGWKILLDYLKNKTFRDDILNFNFLIIQVDTDISNEKNFDVLQFDNNNQPLAAEILINNVIQKLIETIEYGQAGFYQQISEKLIFAISVHSLECWLYAHHNTRPLRTSKTTGCYRALSHLLTTVEKNYRCYDQISKPFLKRKNIDDAVEKDASFRIFIQSLAAIEDQVFNLIQE